MGTYPEGTGLSCFYYGTTTSLVAVPTASTEEPFIFEETTADYQRGHVVREGNLRVTL